MGMHVKMWPIQGCRLDSVYVQWAQTIYINHLYKDADWTAWGKYRCSMAISKLTSVHT